jgi:uncharacterized membrane protein YdbT with pleckstrin-like domain
MKINPRARRKQLMDAGVYDAKSLDLNLRGSLSKSQKVKLLIHSFPWLFVSSLSLIGVVVLIALQITHFGKNFALFIWMIMLSLVGFMGYQHARPFWMDIREGGMKTASGSITKRYYFVPADRIRKRYGANGFFLVRVNNAQFSDSPTLYSSLTEGGSYRLYYAPHSRWVLNVDVT